MKFSSKIQRCELSPMRKFLPYELAAEAKGRKIYHLNIGQPDIETPKAFFDAVKNFQDLSLIHIPQPTPHGSHSGAVREERNGPSPLPDDMRCLPFGGRSGWYRGMECSPLTEMSGAFFIAGRRK